MNKQAVSLTLAAENLLWLRAQALANGRRSVSDFLDRLVSEVRTSGKERAAAARSVVGCLRVDPSDPDLSRADAAVRALFTTSLGRAVGRATAFRARSSRGLASRRRRRG